MLRASLTGLLAYRGRLVATLLAIGLGVGFVTGTMLFVDAIRDTFNGTLAAQERGVDLAVQRTDDADGARGALSFYLGMPLEVAEQVGRVEGVAAAEGRLSSVVRLLDAEGRQLGRAGGQVMATSVASTPQLRWIEATAGRSPAAAGEIAVDANTMETAGLTIGQRLQVVAGEQPRQVTLVGQIDPGVALLASGLGVVALPRTDLEAMLPEPVTYDRVDVIAADGADPEQLAAVIDQALTEAQADNPIPGQYVTLTREELIARAQENLGSQLTGFQILLNAFAGIALFVAAYVIANTFTILVTQRSRQLALLRCLGARRGQVFRATLVEALALGLVGCLLGLALGVALVFALRALFTAIDLPVGEVSLALSPRIILVAVGAGMLMTLIGSVVPALRATRVPPLAAMRIQVLSQTSRPRVTTTILGVLLLGGGAAALAKGNADGEVILSLVGAGATFLGVTALSPFIVGPLARLLGLVSGATRPVFGRLATENAVRNPKRTAATTGALIIGVTLMTTFAVATESARVSALEQLDREFPVDFLITLEQGALPGPLREKLAAAPEFAGWVEARGGLLDLGGTFQEVAGVDLKGLSGPLGESLDLGVRAGSVNELPGFNIGLSAEVARQLRVGYGDALTVNTPERPFQLRVSLVYANEVFGPAMMSHTTLHGLTGGQTTQAVALVKVKDGVSADAARAAIDNAVLATPEAEVRDRAGFVEELTSAVNNLLGLVGGLLGLAIVIALLGIANTLGLSVIERVRESAVLRALGLTRAQLRGMLAVEAVITALIGAVMGLILGLMFAYAALRAVGDIVTIAIPWLQIALGLAAAIVVGLLASVLPGRAAARTNVVRAMATE